MKIKLSILLLIFSSLVASAEEDWCPKCLAEVLADDVFCPSCGNRLKDSSSSESTPILEQTFVPQCQNEDYEPSSSYGGLPFYQGMGRGLVTVCGSPVECVRFSCVTFNAAADSWLKYIGGGEGAGYLAIGVLTVGAAVGTISAVGDVCVGTLDFLTFGTVGDAVWKDQGKSPYFWQRRWGKGTVGGAIF